LIRHTHDTTFSENILEFFKILEESEQFFILFLKKMENLRRFLTFLRSARLQFFFERGVTQIWSLFFIAKLIICLVWITNCLGNSKVKEFFMCFYVICMNKHVGIKVSLFACFMYRRSWHGPPPFSNFLFTNLFSIKFLYFILIFHLFFLILTCSCQYSCNFMLTSNCMCRPYNSYRY
jgi:hypothetical protein